nr:MAG TPA: RRN7 Zinc-finger of RNA-polymerase I-specific TFIIB, Rrn7 [Caudoviricetes sp.]
MRVRVKRCEVCASKLKDGNCTWSECPKCPKYKAGVKDEAKPKAKTTNS